MKEREQELGATTCLAFLALGISSSTQGCSLDQGNFDIDANGILIVSGEDVISGPKKRLRR
jgi:hypothetical protein